MDRMMNYVENGQGRGLKYFTFFSIIFCVLVGIVFSYTFNRISEVSLHSFIKQVPTIEIKGGKVVAPQNAYLAIPFVANENSGFVLDTVNPTPQMAFDNGIYLTTDTVYIKSGNDVQTARLSNAQDIVITPDTLKILLNKVIALLSGMFAVSAFVILWIGYALLYLVVKLFFLILGRTTCPYNRGRSIFVAWSAIVTLDLVLFSFGYGFSLVTAFAFALLLAVFIIFKTPLHSMDVEETLTVIEKTPKIAPKKTPVKKAVIKPVTPKAAIKKAASKPAVTKAAQQKAAVKTVKAAVKKTVKK